LRTFFGQGGSSDADVTSALFGAKKLRIFRNLWCVRTDKEGRGGWASADILWTKGEGVNFSRFCADVFYGRPLDVLCKR